MHVVCLLVWVLLPRYLLGEASADEKTAHARQKRYLVFPQGSNVQLVYCLTINSEGRPAGELVVGLTAALAWELPSKAEQQLDGLIHRSSRSAVYPKIEAFLQSIGVDGRACVMKALCEAGQRRASALGTGSFLQELLHAIFTLDNDGTYFEKEAHRHYDRARRSDGNCTELYPTCEHSIFNLNF